jgi:hypothetical protein
VRLRGQRPEVPEVILRLLDGIGQLLMSIDARLAEVVNLLREDDEEADA